jgi:hypothetical protein
LCRISNDIVPSLLLRGVGGVMPRDAGRRVSP